MILNRNHGFSLIEVLIASGISIGIILYLNQYIKINQASNTRIMSNMENTSDRLNMEAIFKKDLTASKYSLNNLNTKADEGLNFFDYLSNFSCTNNCKRSLKLEINESTKERTKKSVYFIIADTDSGEQQIYNPTEAYVKNTLDFKSLNNQNTLALREKSPWNDSIKKESVLIMIYSPNEVFNSQYGPDTPGKFLSYMGWAGSNNYDGILNAETISDGQTSIYDNRDPRSGNSITSEDQFFKEMPYTVGLGSFVFLTAVKVIRYQLVATTNRGRISGQLMRGELKADKTFTEIPIGFNLKKVEFYRETISSPAINIITENF